MIPSERGAVADAEATPVFEFSGTWPFNGQVKIGGHPVSSVTSFHVDALADGIPVVTLTLVGPGALRLLLAAGAADVRIPDETRQALTALGWTPPSGP
jgi:hypothetical protein